jgi:hypothetical protein
MVSIAFHHCHQFLSENLYDVEGEYWQQKLGEIRTVSNRSKYIKATKQDSKIQSSCSETTSIHITLFLLRSERSAWGHELYPHILNATIRLNRTVEGAVSHTTESITLTFICLQHTLLQ